MRDGHCAPRLNNFLEPLAVLPDSPKHVSPILIPSTTRRIKVNRSQNHPDPSAASPQLNTSHHLNPAPIARTFLENPQFLSIFFRHAVNWSPKQPIAPAAQPQPITRQNDPTPPPAHGTHCTSPRHAICHPSQTTLFFNPPQSSTADNRQTDNLTTVCPAPIRRSSALGQNFHHRDANLRAPPPAMAAVSCSPAAQPPHPRPMPSP